MNNMVVINVPLVTWCVIVSAMSVLVIVRAFCKRRKFNNVFGHIFEIGCEREEIFAPGDSLINIDDICDDED